MKTAPEYAVQMRGIKKSFGEFLALDNIDLSIKKGEIHAILGENGAGKTTIMNILYGIYHADDGEIYLSGEKAQIKTPLDAIKHKIGMVHQHFMLVENFSVTENIILGSEVANKFGVLDPQKAEQKVMDIVQKYGLEVDPRAKIEDISVGMQQRVEILKALFRGADILILDEPTAVLTPFEIESLIKIMKNLVQHGKTIIIITHKLKEIKASSDSCTIVRRGKHIATLDVRTTTEEELGTKMVGRAVKLKAEKAKSNFGRTILEINNLQVENDKKINAVDGLSLKVRAGEIFGIAGVDGNGQKELVEAINNLRKSKSGTIKMNGKEIQNTSVLNILNQKISTIPEDRQKRGLVLDFTVAENAALKKYRTPDFSKNGILNKSKILDFSKSLIKNYNINPPNCQNIPCRGLSGGNQQKVIIAREISEEPELLIAVQPTRGLDVGAIEYVHKVLIEQREAGKAVLLISLELDEIMNIADTISVIYNGKIVKTFPQGEVNEETIGLLMAGGNSDAVCCKNA